MNRAIKVLSAVLILIALLIAVYAWLLATKPAQSNRAAPLTQIHQTVVANRAIAAGDTLRAELVKVSEVPTEVAGGFQTAAEVIGRVAVMPIAAGAPLLESQLNTGLAARVAPGERAVAIRTDEQSGVGYRVRPGDYVDVFVLLRRDGNELERSEARLLLPRLRVLSFGSASVDGTEAGNSKAQEVIHTAVLAVPVDRIPELALGDNAGKLTLALRNPTDLATPDQGLFAARAPGVMAVNGSTVDASSRARAGIALTDLENSTPMHVAAKPVATQKIQTPISKSSVDVIRAGKLETVAY